MTAMVFDVHSHCTCIMSKLGLLRRWIAVGGFGRAVSFVRTHFLYRRAVFVFNSCP